MFVMSKVTDLPSAWLGNEQLVGNKAKGRISKRMFQENKARQISRKTISDPLIHFLAPLIRTPNTLSG